MAKAAKSPVRKRGTVRKPTSKQPRATRLKTIKSSVKGATTSKKRSSSASSGKSSSGGKQSKSSGLTISVNGKVVHKS